MMYVHATIKGLYVLGVGTETDFEFVYNELNLNVYTTVHNRTTLSIRTVYKTVSKFYHSVTPFCGILRTLAPTTY